MLCFIFSWKDEEEAKVSSPSFTVSKETMLEEVWDDIWRPFTWEIACTRPSLIASLELKPTPVIETETTVSLLLEFDSVEDVGSKFFPDTLVCGFALAWPSLNPFWKVSLSFLASSVALSSPALTPLDQWFSFIILTVAEYCDASIALAFSVDETDNE